MEDLIYVEKQKHDNRAKELTAAASSPASTTGSTSAAGPLPFRGHQDAANVARSSRATSLPQAAGSPTIWRDHTGNGWAARPAAPLDESMRIPWDLYHADFADMINSLVMKTFKSQLDIYSHPDFVGRFRAQCLPMVQKSAEDIFDQQLADADDQMFTASHMGLVHSGDWIDDADGSGASNGGGDADGEGGQDGDEDE